MEALRIVLTQASANYRKEESDRNKMTYPLPPFSTVIGAIHKACGWTEYHPMELSIQGNYQALHREPYTDYCFLNTVNDDRNILVKISNESMLTRGMTKVAYAKKNQSSFREGITIGIYEKTLLKEYRDLLDLRDQISDFKKIRISRVMVAIKKRKKTLKEQKKIVVKGSREYEQFATREIEIKQIETEIKQKFEAYKSQHYTIPYSKFKSLTTSLKYYEILNEVELIIHITADKDILETVLEHIYDIKAIGRSEDFVEVEEAKIVQLDTCKEEVVSKYAAYLNYEDVVENKDIITRGSPDKPINGTKYYINKDYYYVGDRKTRQFNKCKVIYASQYSVDSESQNVWIDEDGDNRYIVNLM